jgi:hypothetical protein
MLDRVHQTQIADRAVVIDAGLREGQDSTSMKKYLRSTGDDVLTGGLFHPQWGQRCRTSRQSQEASC